jgi:hypothetical protein
LLEIGFRFWINYLVYACTSHNRTVYASPLKRLGVRSARSWLRHSHASLRYSLATLQTYGLLIRVAKPSYTTGTLSAIGF